ncbi:hypothetical protein HUW46_01838 [Amycolatopsis sp. CA-230715]|nr:hypothetical protein HUW46_01838 [Amycolatopsis sp. CA-230715]
MVWSVEDFSDHLDEVTSAMGELTEVVGTEDDLGVVLGAVCDQVTRVIPGADLASVTVIRDGVPSTEAFTDPRAERIDRGQYASGAGPCLRAAETGAVVRVSVGTAAELWPGFTESALELGVASYLAAPLRVDETLSGAMNLFGFGPHGFNEVEEKLLDLYTMVVAATLKSARRYLRARASVDQLRQALDRRAVIEQAKGIMMAARGLTPDEAFGELVKRSQRENVKLNDVAAEFVAEATRAVRPK